jgi:hypothetical protein
MTLEIGDVTYHLVTTERNGQWIAHAVNAVRGERFGIETNGATEAEATSRLTRWLEWQHEHTLALEALQEAERAYHRALADAAFAAPDGQAEATRDCRQLLDARRNQLDDIRARRPRVEVA